METKSVSGASILRLSQVEPRREQIRDSHLAALTTNHQALCAHFEKHFYPAVTRKMYPCEEREDTRKAL